jgi:hypothetical protein
MVKDASLSANGRTNCSRSAAASGGEHAPRIGLRVIWSSHANHKIVCTGTTEADDIHGATALAYREDELRDLIAAVRA